MPTVLVTGGSGYIASFCLIELIKRGYEVRTTLRTLEKEPQVRDMLRAGGVDPGTRLTCFAADLENDAGWARAIAGCDYVLHVASPTLTTIPKNDDEMVRPAREGVLRVLKNARDQGVKRVVLTSAFGAVGYGHAPRNTPFTEDDWTNLDGGIAPYQKSKTLAERAAWDFIKNEGRGLELSVVNPLAVLGPVLGPDYSPSLGIVSRMLNGEIAYCPKFKVGFVDVRDVADLHIRAMIHPEANGQRFLAVSGRSYSFLELARMLHRNLGARAAKAPTRELPNWVMRLVARFNPAVRFFLPQLGKDFDATSRKANRLLGWSARDLQETVTDTAESLLALR